MGKKLTIDEILTIMQQIEDAEKHRAQVMPTEKEALIVMFTAYQRLKDLGFNDACYCPKDGTLFDCIEAGSTGIHTGKYDGEWPTGHYWILDGDIWPGRPILYRPKDKAPEPKG